MKTEKAITPVRYRPPARIWLRSSLVMSHHSGIRPVSDQPRLDTNGVLGVPRNREFCTVPHMGSAVRQVAKLFPVAARPRLNLQPNTGPSTDSENAAPIGRCPTYPPIPRRRAPFLFWCRDDPSRSPETRKTPYEAGVSCKR